MRFRRHQEAAEAATSGMLLGFAAALLALVVAVNLGLALLWRLVLPITGGYPALFFQTNTAVVLLFVVGGCWIETLRLRDGGGAHVARLAGARPVGSGATPLERRLVNVVQEIALAARVPPPAAWLLPRALSINAFAAGWTRDDAVIAVTQGALERLTRAELQGLVGHEVGHLASGDTRLHTRLVGLVWGLQLVHGFGLSLAEPDAQGRRGAGAIVGGVLVVVGYAGWIAGRILQAGVARQREFRADAAAVQYARTVDGIGGALCKIAGLPAFDRDAPRAPASLAHLWIAETEGFGLFGWRRWLAMHPPIALRLQRLYGREVEALDAPLLSLPDAADEPVLAFAPASRPAAAARAAAPAAAGAIDPQDERDALQRAAFWRSPGECQAALLAWLIADDGDAAPWAAWQQIVGPSPFAPRLRSDWLTMGPAARWQVFDAIVTRTQGSADRGTLIRAARSLAPQGAARLRRLLLMRALRGAPPARGTLPLETLTPAFAAATALLSQALGAPGVAWAATLDASTPASAWPAFGLRRLHAMQRPRVARAWVAGAAQAGLLRDTTTIGLLVTACRLLDTPPPAALAVHQPRIL